MELRRTALVPASVHRVAIGAATVLALFAAPAAAQSSPHEIQVELGEGIAVVRETLRFARDGFLTQTLQARLPVPQGAVLRSLRVCAGTRCRRGGAAAGLAEVFTEARQHRARPGQAPLALASISSDSLLRVLATEGLGPESTTVTVEWAAPTRSAGLLEYLVLPARQELTASPRVEASSSSLDAPRVHAPGELHEARVVVGTRRTSPASDRALAHVAILVDASPSTRDHADAIRRLTEALLRSLPSDVLVTIVSFASRAILVSDAQRAAQLLGDASLEVYRPAGTRARPASAWALASGARLVDDVVWLGDGLLSSDAEASETLTRIVDSGARLHAFSVTSALSDGLRGAAGRSHGVVHLSEHERAPLLEAAFASAWAPQTAPPVRESAALAQARAALRSGLPDELAAVDPADVSNARKQRDGGRASFRAGGGLYPRPVFRCGLRTHAPEFYGSMSRAVIRRAIQRSVVPRVRGCFRSARAGRPGWSARVDARIVVVRGEVVAAMASGGGEELDRCVQSAFDDLDLPALQDPIVVNYPFVARAIALPSAQDLGVAAPELDALLTRFEAAPPADAWPMDSSFLPR